MRNELSYYNEILESIKANLKSNFCAAGRNDIDVLWGKGELKTNLARIITENENLKSLLYPYMQKVQPLDLDVFGVITDGVIFRILILEVKLLKGVGLKEWSQLIGYCLVSDAKYGLLINIDGGCSQRLQDILLNERHMSEIVNSYNGLNHTHYLGFMVWNSITKNFEYSGFGFLRTLSMISNELIKEFG